MLAQVDPGRARDLIRQQQTLLQRFAGTLPTQRDYALAGPEGATP